MGELGNKPGNIPFNIVGESGGTIIVNEGEGENSVEIHGTLAEGGGAVNIDFHLGGFIKIEMEGSSAPLNIYDVLAEAGFETNKHFGSRFRKDLVWVKVFFEEDNEP